MKNKLTEQQLNDILKAFDDTLQQGPWEESNFLRVIGKNLKEIRESFLQQHPTPMVAENPNLTPAQAVHIANAKNQQEVYIALYSSEGNNFQTWERILANLPRQMISRPIYSNEEHIQAITKTKENKVNEAYVAIYIDPSNILSLAADKTPTDKLGVPLLSLKNNALSLDKITRFVHQHTTYDYTNWHLIKNNKIDN